MEPERWPPLQRKVTVLLPKAYISQCVGGCTKLVALGWYIRIGLGAVVVYVVGCFRGTRASAHRAWLYDIAGDEKGKGGRKWRKPLLYVIGARALTPRLFKQMVSYGGVRFGCQGWAPRKAETLLLSTACGNTAS